MHFNCNKPWKTLIDRFWKNKKMENNYGISSSSVVRLEKDVNLTTEMLPEIYKSLPCDIVTFWDLCEINTFENKRIEVTFTQNE